MLIRVLMQPLTDMGRAMQDIAQGEGDLTKRLKVTSNDEFGTLANAFNRFVERIHESIREVAGTARQLHDVAQLVVNASNSSMANSDEQSNRTNSVAAAINELGAAAQKSPATPPMPRTMRPTPTTRPRTASRWSSRPSAR